MPTRSARTAWNGGLQDGSGQVELTSSGAGTFDVNFPKRAAEDADGTTSPEELVAAAHSACYAMSLSQPRHRGRWHGPGARRLRRRDAGSRPEAGGFRLTGIQLTVRGEVDGLDEAGVQGRAEQAKADCPISKALDRRRHHARRRARGLSPPLVEEVARDRRRLQVSEVAVRQRRRGQQVCRRRALPSRGSPRRWCRCTRCRSCRPCGRRRRARRARPESSWADRACGPLQRRGRVTAGAEHQDRRGALATDRRAAPRWTSRRRRGTAVIPQAKIRPKVGEASSNSGNSDGTFANGTDVGSSRQLIE